MIRTLALLGLSLLAFTSCSAGGGGGKPAPASAVISTHPADQTVDAGTIATFGVVASNATAYQWQRSTDGGSTFADVAGATAADCSTAATTPADDGTRYRVVVSGAANRVTSSAARLTVVAVVAPSITVQPVPQTVAAGLDAGFTVIASGSSLAFQWERSTDGGATFADLPGATGSTLSLSAVGLADSGHRFRARVTNGAGSVTSDAALLTVNPLPVLESIVFTSEVDTYEGVVSNVYLIKEDGSGLVTLATSATFNAYDASSGRVVYSYFDGMQVDLTSVRPDASGVAYLTSSQDNEEFAGVAAGGRVIYRIYTQDQNGTPEYNLYSAPIAGGANAVLANTASNEELLDITASGRVIYRDAGTDVLYGVNGDGSSKATLTNTTGTETYLGSTAGGRIVYRRTVGTQDDLFSVNADGTGTVPLANASTNEYFEAITPSGRVIYVRTGTAGAEIHSVGADGSGELTLMSASNSRVVPAITGDERVIIDRTVGYQHDLLYAAADGTSGLVGIATTANDERFAGLTVGGQIVYARAPMGYTPGDLYCFTPGVGVSTLATSLDMETFAGSTAERVIFNRIVAGQNDLYSVRTDGTGLQSLASSSLSEEFVRTDGAGRVIYRIDAGGQFDLYGVNADGTGAVTLANSSDSEEVVAVTRNGRVIYRRNVGGTQYDLYSVSSDGSVTVPLATAAYNETFRALF